MVAVQPVGTVPATTLPLVRVENLKKHFPLGGSLLKGPTSFIHAVDNISFEILPGRSLALVGESGSGKTTTGKLLVRLIPPTGGHIYMSDEQNPGRMVDLARLRGRDLREFRRRVQMIFQDPYESLNPRLSIFDAVAEPLAVQGIGSLAEREERVAHMLEQVGLSPATSFMFRFPHELSGGQRQRVAIARALVVNPGFIVADEPTSMLDVSIRTGIMKLMIQLAQKLEVSYLYITHDLAVARYTSDQIAVMYMGKIVEMGPTEEVLMNPLHPYTKALISAVPVPDPLYKRQPPAIEGSISRPIDPVPRCRFYERCPLAAKICAENDHPPLEDKGGGHYAACYLV
ncbi:MAG TPA: ABC transporter ATP-binding protein [Chloroflexi bacterium]|jgi:peptide/nickel transport system ATP-binding protein|nr:ABC transporter ATP-binding protein [Chloroflexota bacterium]